MSKELLESSKAYLKPALFKKACPLTPYWDNFIHHFDYQFNNSNYPHKVTVGSQTSMINGTLLKERFYVSAFQATDKFYPQLNYATSLLENWYGDTHDNAFALMNFVGNEAPVQVHMDRRDSFYWQCIGSSIWEIFDSADSASPTESHTLTPGDVIFVPEGMYHRIVTPEARAAISICFNSKTKF